MPEHLNETQTLCQAPFANFVGFWAGMADNRALGNAISQVLEWGIKSFSKQQNANYSNGRMQNPSPAQSSIKGRFKPRLAGEILNRVNLSGLGEIPCRGSRFDTDVPAETLPLCDELKNVEFGVELPAILAPA